MLQDSASSSLTHLGTCWEAGQIWMGDSVWTSHFLSPLPLVSSSCSFIHLNFSTHSFSSSVSSVAPMCAAWRSDNNSMKINPVRRNPHRGGRGEGGGGGRVHLRTQNRREYGRITSHQRDSQRAFKERVLLERSLMRCVCVCVYVHLCVRASVCN